MKHLSLTIITLFTITAIFAQSTQYGYVEEYHGAKDKTPLANVNIIAGGATARSGADGKFKLDFKTLKVGDRVNANPNNVATLKDYVLFNKEAVEQWTVSGKNVFFRIVLCKKKVFDNLVMTYYNVSDKSLREQLRRERARAEQLRRSGEIQQQEYEQQLREAEERYMNAQKHLMENAELVARIDESELDEEQAHILQLAKEGRLDEAVELIRKSKTAEMFDQAVRKNQHAAEQRQHYEQVVAESQEEWNRLLARLDAEEHIIRDAMQSDSADNAAKAYLCMSLLLQGRYDEAKTLATQIKDIIYDGKPLKERMLHFIAKLEEKKIIPESRKADVARFRELLND